MNTFVTRAMSALAGLFLTGCVTHVFNSPVTLSTRSDVARFATPVGPVAAEQTNSVYVIIPVVSDPRNLYDDFLSTSSAMGANAVMDVQWRDKWFFMWMFPCIMRDTTELSGTAVKVK